MILGLVVLAGGGCFIYAVGALVGVWARTPGKHRVKAPAVSGDVNLVAVAESHNPRVRSGNGAVEESGSGPTRPPVGPLLPTTTSHRRDRRDDR